MALHSVINLTVAGHPEIRGTRIETSTGWLYVFGLLIGGEQVASDSCHARNPTHTPANPGLSPVTPINNDSEMLVSITVSLGEIFIVIMRSGDGKSGTISCEFVPTV